MIKRTIKWEKFRNPLLNVSPDEDGERIMVRNTPFGPEGMRFNPDFPEEQVYIAHTNFDIDDDVKEILDNMEGIEIVEVYSAYRMRVTIGKAFNPKRIRRLIKERLCYSSPPKLKFGEETDLNIYKETLRLNSQDKLWFMYVLPNGSFESQTFDNEEDREKCILKYEHVRKSIGGVILAP